MNIQKIYDRDYFENGVKAKKSNYFDYSWERLGSYFQATAEHIKNSFKPQKLLDVGTAKGFLVYALSELGVDACGIDVSEYAVQNAKVKDKVQIGKAQDIAFQDGEFDVVTIFDVLGHIPEAEVPQVCAELLRVSKKWVVARVPTRKEQGDLDAFHETVKPKEWWKEQFATQGGKVVSCEPFVNRGVWWFNIPEYLIVIEKQEKPEAEKPKKKQTKKKSKKTAKEL
jgi:ubiquinone/menaquinone biosynthesis C-methylase UbiE